MKLKFSPKHKILVLTLSLMLILTTLVVAVPSATLTAQAAGVAGGDTLTPDTSGTTFLVYYGEYNGNPMRWRVVAEDTTTLTLLNHDGLLLADGTSLDKKKFDSGNYDAWSGSDICLYLNGAFLNSFSTGEQAVIPVYGTTEQANPDIDRNSIIDITQQIVLPSVIEVKDDGTWGMVDAVRTFDEYWWLRSFGYIYNDASFVITNGLTNAFGARVYLLFAVRPALKVNQSSVLFSSSAVGGKPTLVGANLSATVSLTVEQKLTIIDPSQVVDITATETQLNQTGVSSLEFGYNGATTGTKQYVSCVLTNSSGVAYYGKLADTSATSGGTLNIPLAGVADGTYTLKIFSEQANADKYTDYASTPIESIITVNSEQGQVDKFGGTALDITAPTINSVTPSTQSEEIAGNVVISFSEPMDTTAGTITLNGTNLSGGAWSNRNQTYTVAYSGLSYDTNYTIDIADFRDVSGKAITATNKSFKTKIEPADPTVSPAALTIVEGETGVINVAMGQGAVKADSVNVVSGNMEVATVSTPSLTASGSVTVTGKSAGSTTVTLGFSGGSLNGTTKDVSVNVTAKQVTPPQTNYYTVNFDLAGGAHTGGGALSQSVAENGSATAPTTAREGYTFICWDKDFSNITANITITAHWKANETVNPPKETGFSSGGSSYSGSSKIDTSPNLAVNTQTTSYTQAQFDKDFAAAVANILTGQTNVVVKAKNYNNVDGSVLNYVYQTAQNKGLTITIQFDETTGNAVKTRLYVTPTASNKSINLVGSSAKAEKLTAHFANYFSNDTLVLSYESTGAETKLATKLPTGMNDDNLVVYSYNSDTNIYTKIDVKISVDSNGYAHFTALQGNIVISDGVLVKK